MAHRNARLTPTGRLELVKLMVEHGRRSKSTVSTWVGRWRAASDEERRTLRCLEDRSSRPHRSPRVRVASEQQRICAERRRTGWVRA